MLAALLSGLALSAVLSARFPLHDSIGEVTGWCGSLEVSGAVGRTLEGRGGVAGAAVSCRTYVAAERSVALWVKTTRNTTLLSITPNRNVTSEFEVSISTTGAVEVYLHGTLAASAATRVLSSTWHHIAIIQGHSTVTSGAYLHIFVDGALRTLNTTSATPLTTTDSTMSVTLNPYEHSDVFLSDVNIFSGSLSAEDAQWMSATEAKPSDAPPSFVACFVFAETLEVVSTVYGEVDPVLSAGEANQLYSSEDMTRRGEHSGWAKVFPSEDTEVLEGCAQACRGYRFFGVRLLQDTPHWVPQCYCRQGLPQSGVLSNPETTCGGLPRGGISPSYSGTMENVAVYTTPEHQEEVQTPDLTICKGGTQEAFLDNVGRVGETDFFSQAGNAVVYTPDSVVHEAYHIHRQFHTRKFGCNFLGKNGTDAVRVENSYLPGAMSFWMLPRVFAETSIFTFEGILKIHFVGKKLRVTYTDAYTGQPYIESPVAMVSGRWYHIKLVQTNDVHMAGLDLFVNGENHGQRPAEFSPKVSFAEVVLGSGSFSGILYDINFYRQAYVNFVERSEHNGVYRDFCSDGSLYEDASRYRVHGKAEQNVHIARDVSDTKNFCDLNGGSIAAGTGVLNYPFSVAAFVKVPFGCSSNGVNVSQILGSVFGWHDPSSSSSISHPYIPLYHSNGRFYTGSWNYEKFAWDEMQCDNTWRHLAFTATQDKRFQVYFDGILSFSGEIHPVHFEGSYGMQFVPLESRLGGRYVNGEWLGSHLHIKGAKLFTTILSAPAIQHIVAEENGNAFQENAPYSEYCKGSNIGEDTGTFRKHARHIGSVKAGEHGGCRFSGADSCLQIPTFAALPTEFTISAWVRIDSNMKGGARCEAIKDLYINGASQPMSRWVNNMQYGYYLNAAEELNTYPIFSMKGPTQGEGFDFAEATLALSENFYPIWREVDANGRARISSPKDRVGQNLCLSQGWTHLAVSFASKNVTMFVNGNKIGVNSIAPSAPFVKGTVLPDTSSHPMFSSAGVGCGGFAGEVLGLQLHTTPLSAMQVAEAAQRILHFSEGGVPSSSPPRGDTHNTALRICRAGLADESGWARRTSFEEKGDVFSQPLDTMFLNQRICSLQGEGRFFLNELKDSNDLFDRPDGVSIMFWARRNLPASDSTIGCEARGSGAYFSMVKQDETVLEYQGEGYEPRLYEGRKLRTARHTSTVSFSSCETPCSNTTGWRSPSYPLDTCLLWAPPCGIQNTSTILYATITASTDNTYTTTFYTDNSCNGTYEAGSQIFCGKCHTLGFTLSHINDIACDAMLTEEDLVAGFLKHSAGSYDATSARCDTDWHHHAIVIPKNRVGVRFFYDFLPTKLYRSNGSAPLLSTSPVKFISFGQRFDNVYNSSFLGKTYSDLADITVFNRALSTTEIYSEKRVTAHWVKRRGECTAGYYKVFGASLAECKRRCQETDNCRAFHFPLPSMDTGCAIHTDEQNAPSCRPIFASNLTLYFPQPAFQEGGEVFKLCDRQFPRTEHFSAMSNYSTTPFEYAGQRRYGCTAFSMQLAPLDVVLQSRPFEFSLVGFFKLNLACDGDNSVSLMEWGDNNGFMQSIGFSAFGELQYSSGGSVRTTTCSAVPFCRRGGGSPVWRSFAVTMTRSGLLSLYIDNVLVTTSSGNHPWSLGGLPIQVGGTRQGGNVLNSFEGSVSNVRLYNKCLGEVGVTLADVLPPFGSVVLKVCGEGDGVFGNYTAFLRDESGAQRDPSWYRHVEEVGTLGLTREWTALKRACFFNESDSVVHWDAAGGAPLRSEGMSLSVFVKLQNCSGVNPIASWGGVPSRGAMLYLNDGVLVYSEKTSLANPSSVFSIDDTATLCNGGWAHIALSISVRNKITLSMNGNSTTIEDGSNLPANVFTETTNDFSGDPGLNGNYAFNKDFTIGSGTLWGRENGFGCPSNWTACGAKCYRVNTAPLTYANAERDCLLAGEVLGVPTSMGTIRSAEEHTCARGVTDYNDTASLPTYQGIVHTYGYPTYADSVGIDNRREVDYHPNGHFPLQSSTTCWGVDGSGNYVALSCTAARSSLCEFTRQYSFGGVMSGFEMRHGAGPSENLEPEAIRDAIASLNRDLPENRAPSPTASQTWPLSSDPALCDVTEIADSILNFTGPGGSEHSNVVAVVAGSGAFTLWLKGTHLEGCSLYVQNDTIGSYAKVALQTTKAMGMGGVSMATATFVEDAVREVPLSAVVPILVKHDIATADEMRGTNFSLYLSRRIPVSSLHISHEGTNVHFKQVVNLFKFPEAVIGVATAGNNDDSCGTIVTSLPIGRRYARHRLGITFPPAEGSGGEYEVCAKYTPDAQFERVLPDGNATIHIAGRCNSNGIYIFSTKRCSCYLDEMHGYWAGEGCATCAEGFFGATCQHQCSPGYCHFRGNCTTTGTCSCELGFIGARCEEQLPCSLVHKAVLTPDLSRRRHGDYHRKHTVSYPLLTSLSDTSLHTAFLAYGNVTSFTEDGLFIDNGGSTPQAYEDSAIAYIETAPSDVNISRGAVSFFFKNLVATNMTRTGVPITLPFVCIGDSSFTALADPRRFYYSQDACVVVKDGSFWGSLKGEEVRGGSTELEEDVWHHMVMSYAHGTMQVYVDGVLDVTLFANATNTTMTGGYVSVGAHTARIKNVLLSREAFTAADVTSIFSIGLLEQTSLTCPGECEGNSFITSYDFQHNTTNEYDHANSVFRTYIWDARRNIKGRVLHSIASTPGGVIAGDSSMFLRLSGNIVFDTAAVLPQDEWTVSAWFRDNMAGYSSGCVFAATYQTAVPRATPDQLAAAVASNTLYENGVRISSQLCRYNTTPTTEALSGTLFSPFQTRTAVFETAFLNATMWHHVVHKYTFAGQEVYLDGALVARTEPVRASHAHTTVWLGYGTYGFWQGDIADVQLFSKGISSREIAKLFRAGRNDNRDNVAEETHKAADREAPTVMKLGKGKIAVRRFPK